MKRRWDVLRSAVHKHGWKRGAEIGVYEGETFRHLLTHCPDLYLIGVDLWDSAYFQSTREGRPKRAFDLEASHDKLQAWIDRHAIGRARLYRCDTVAAAANVHDGWLDFAFVDADHRYDAVRADIAAWMPKIRLGGMMLGHDYNPKEFPGVVQAVNESFGGAVAVHDDHVWSVQC